MAIAEIRALSLQGPGPRATRDSRASTDKGNPLVDELNLTVGLLDCQLGARFVAEELIRFLALSAEGCDGGAVGAGEIDGKDRRGGCPPVTSKDENGRAQDSDAMVTAAPAAKVLKSGAGTGEYRTALEEALKVCGERARVRVPAMGLLLETLQADRLKIARDFCPEPPGRYRLLGSDLLDRVGGRRSLEGRSAREQFIG